MIDLYRYLPVARQAGSKDPVRRCVVEKDGSRGGCGLTAGRARTAAFGRTLSRREYPETMHVGDCFGSLGPAALQVATPGEAESVQVGVTEARRRP